MSQPLFEFPGFPMLPNEERWQYIERYNRERSQYRPWEAKAPAAPPPEQRLPYREPGEDD